MVGRISALLTLLILSFQALADLSATVSSTRLVGGDTVVLTLTDTDNSGELPDLSPLRKNFEVLGQSSSQNISIINGARQAKRDWIITLFPRSTGNVTIPALGSGKHRSKAITLSIKDAPKNQTVPTANSPVVESEVDRNSVYVGGQILLTLRIKHLGNMVSPSLNPPEVENATVTPVHDANFQRVIQGQNVAVFERTYAIHPEVEGTLEIPGQLLQAHMASGRQGFFGNRNTKQVIRKSTAHEITVKPLPDFASGKETVTANDLTIEQYWSPSLENLKVGDSVTRSLIIKSKGATSAAIPPIFESQVAGIKQYQDQPVLEDSTDQNGVSGIRKQSTAYVMTETGDFELPPIVLYWVNAETGKVQSASLPSTYFSVAAGEAGASVPNTASSQDSSSPLTASDETTTTLNNYQQHPLWFWATIFFASLWLITVAAWLLLPKKEQKPVKKAVKTDDTEAMLFNALKDACKQNNAVNTLQAFNRWGQSLDKGLKTNQDICRYLNDEHVSKSIERADRHSFNKNSDNAWQGKTLINHLIPLRKKLCSKTTKTSHDIYP